jgi:hypothetical protein
MKYDITHAISSLRPNSAWGIVGTDYDTLEWIDPQNSKPKLAELEAEIARLQAVWDTAEYQRKRAAEYPPITDYLDGIVKGDAAQVEAYIAACQAVKNKYPKPE